VARPERLELEAFRGPERSVNLGTRGVRVTGWGAGAPKMSADVEPYAAPPALRDCVAKHAHS